MKSWPFDSPLDDPCREACGWISAARAEWDEDDLNLVGHVHSANEPAPVSPSPGRTALIGGGPHIPSAPDPLTFFRRNERLDDGFS